MPSRRLEDLHPLIAEKAQQLIELAQDAGIEILVTSTLRSFDEQAELFAIGRTKPGKKVTNAEPGKSWHKLRFGLRRCAARERQSRVGQPVLETNRRAWETSGFILGGFDHIN